MYGGSWSLQHNHRFTVAVISYEQVHVACAIFNSVQDSEMRLICFLGLQPPSFLIEGFEKLPKY